MKTIPCLLAGAAMLILAGCNVLPEQQADTVRYFTLGGAVPAKVAPGATTVRPVRVAGHLRNRAMAVRVAGNEVVYLDDVRWAEPLGDAITDLLAARLGAIAGNSVVSAEVQRCELIRFENNAIQLTATFTVLPSGDRENVKRGVFTASPRTWDGKDYGTLVTLLQDAVDELAGAIAAVVSEK